MLWSRASSDQNFGFFTRYLSNLNQATSTSEPVFSSTKKEITTLIGLFKWDNNVCKVLLVECLNNKCLIHYYYYHYYHKGPESCLWILAISSMKGSHISILCDDVFLLPATRSQNSSYITHLPRGSSTTSKWQLTRNTDSGAPPSVYWIRICFSARSLGDL